VIFEDRQGHGFAEDKGDWWMTEDSYVDTRVLEFADYIQCDPELAQELYFLEVQLKPR
jgi:hypothetical protein